MISSHDFSLFTECKCVNWMPCLCLDTATSTPSMSPSQGKERNRACCKTELEAENMTYTLHNILF